MPLAALAVLAALAHGIEIRSGRRRAASSPRIGGWKRIKTAAGKYGIDVAEADWRDLKGEHG